MADFNLDEIADQAKLTKKSIYYHFPSKDGLTAATADFLRRDYLAKCRQWFRSTGENESFRERALVATREFADHARQPSWKGCGFARLTAEISNQPSHPAHAILVDARRQTEKLFEAMIARDGRPNAAGVACQMVIFVNGLVLMLLQDRSGKGVPEAIELLGSILA